MKTATINGKRVTISYKTNTSMYTRLSPQNGGKTAQYGADIYSVDNDNDNIVIVATSHNGSTLKKTTTVITRERYDDILEIYDPYNEFPFHSAIMNELGFQ